jgi:hypothetical protein
MVAKRRRRRRSVERETRDDGCGSLTFDWIGFLGSASVFGVVVYEHVVGNCQKWSVDADLIQNHHLFTSRRRGKASG